MIVYRVFLIYRFNKLESINYELILPALKIKVKLKRLLFPNSPSSCLKKVFNSHINVHTSNKCQMISSNSKVINASAYLDKHNGLVYNYQSKFARKGIFMISKMMTQKTRTESILDKLWKYEIIIAYLTYEKIILFLTRGKNLLGHINKADT